MLQQGQLLSFERVWNSICCYEGMTNIASFVIMILFICYVIQVVIARQVIRRSFLVK